jgi:hypothetical protein
MAKEIEKAQLSSALKDGKREFYRHLDLDVGTLRLIEWFRLVKISMNKEK